MASYNDLWEFEGLDSSQERFIHSSLVHDLYETGWESRIDGPISHNERVAARDQLRDEFMDAGMIFEDVFDYDQWVEDMGYGEAAA